MSQLTENKQYSIIEILEKLRSQVDAMPISPTSSRYLRALESLESSVLTLNPSLAPSPFTIDSLQTCCNDWLVNQWLLGAPFSTASLYLDIISSLYGSAVKAGQLPKTTLFSNLKAQLKALGPEGWKSGIDEEIFARALRLTKHAPRLIADDYVAADLVIWSLTHVLRPLDSIALLKREDISPSAPLHEVIDTIISRQCGNARRKYIFPLRQSERTPKQLVKHIARIVNALFKRARLPQATDPFQTVEALWAYAALRTGVPASVLVSHLGPTPLGLPVLRLSRREAERQSAPEDLDSVASQDSRLKTEDLAAIGRVFLDNPPRWYAMSLRPGVRFTQVCRRIQLLSKTSSSQDSRLKTQDFLSDIELFYPCEEIARAIGKKIVIRERPFIHSVVFFRARLTDIGRLFARIGDLAWCYRRSARPGAPYADISDRQFRLFQQTIARFTPDYEVASAGELELKKDDRVQILGGLFAGHEATFSSACTVSKDSSLEPEDPHTVYRLNIVGDNGIEWRVNVDSRLLRQSK